jgi:hypothetical protein
MRFNGASDKVTVTIPDSALLPGASAATPLTLEAWFFPRAWKGYAVNNFQVLSLFQNYDSVLEVKDGIWNIPKCPTVYGGNYKLLTNAQWDAGVSLNHWHLLRLTLYADKTVKCFIDGNLMATVTATSFAVGRSNAWTLNLGNFDGDVDEVRVSRSTRE